MKIKIAIPGSMHATSHGKPAFNGDIEVKIINDNYNNMENITNVIEFCGFAIAKVGKNIPCVHPVKDITPVAIGSYAKNNTDGDYHREHNTVRISKLCYMKTVDDAEEDKVCQNIYQVSHDRWQSLHRSSFTDNSRDGHPSATRCPRKLAVRHHGRSKARDYDSWMGLKSSFRAGARKARGGNSDCGRHSDYGSGGGRCRTRRGSQQYRAGADLHGAEKMAPIHHNGAQVHRGPCDG